MQKLVEDLRRLAELEEHRLEGAQVDLQAVLEEAIALASCMPERSRRTVGLHLPSVPWPLAAVWGDHDLLVLAFCNLLDNALKFTTG